MNLLGAYHPAVSMLHSLDPAYKIISFSFLFAAVVIFSSSIAGYFISALIILFLFYIAHVPVHPVLKSLWRFRAFFLTIFLMNSFFHPSETPIFSFYFITFSFYGIAMGIRMVMCVAILTSLSALLTATTTPIAITKGLNALLHPLSYLHIPVKQAAEIISMALCLIPLIAKESEDIVMSAKARGLGSGSGKLKDRALSMAPLVIPLFVQSFRRADEMAMAMEARGYSDGHHRRRMRIKTGSAEILILLISILILLISIFMKGVFV